ncbi:MAG: LD-carboxypeptidase [Ktedonobacteraceae bacterium]|nr:LD-carboxypeptidase [Ktedonobacteraceae bacterium]
MATSFVRPPKLQPGDKVAILSPSSGLPEIFPAVYEQGLRRLQDLFQLTPVEYPTTCKMNSLPTERAEDVHAAFLDPEIKGIISSIGGDDEIKVLKYLDLDVLKAHPKAFFGYSDNTNLHLLLWNLGIVSYYRGSILVHFGRGGSMHPYTISSLKKALFEQGTFELQPASSWTDQFQDWNDPRSLQQEPQMFPGTGWQWHNEGQIVEGITWGGNLEIISWNLSANRYILPVETYAGKIFYLETSEEMPSATEVYRILMCMGERGLLEQFSAVLVARPQSWSFEKPYNAQEKVRFCQEQKDAILNALSEYNPGAMVIFDLDFGHTDPQCIIPNGGKISIDGIQKQIFVAY